MSDEIQRRKQAAYAEQDRREIAREKAMTIEEVKHLGPPTHLERLFPKPRNRRERRRMAKLGHR